MLFKNDNVGAVDVVIDPTNSQIVYAALWNTRRPTWYTYQPTNGPGGGIYKSTNGGTTWTLLSNGLPTECVGRSGLAVAPGNPRRLYAVVDDFLPEGAPAGTACPGTPSAGRGAGTGVPAVPGSVAGVTALPARGAGAAGAAAGAAPARAGGGAPAAQAVAQQGGFYRFGRRRRDVDEAVR